MAKFKNAYSTPIRKPFLCEGESMTKQNHKTECDINFIIRKYQKTGLITHVSKYQGDYSDLTDVMDYQSALHLCMDAQEAFNSLPSSIRKHFSNDPAQFLSFVSDPSNLEEMYRLGIAERPQVVPPAVGTVDAV